MGNLIISDYRKKEYCGVLGISSSQPVAHDIYLALMNLQHRGQDSAGAATVNSKGITLVRGLGLVSDVLDDHAQRKLQGNTGIGHVRYPTVGAGGFADAQPFTGYAKGKKFALAHNGNIANYGKIKKQIKESGTPVHSCCDAEIMLLCFLEAYRKKQDFFHAAKEHMQKLDGGYSVVIVTDSGQLIAFRDPQAIRPLCWGQDKEKTVFASESVALDIIGCKLQGDVKPGEVFVVDKGKVKRKIVARKKAPQHCMFEYVYFSRPDSKLDAKWVYEVRYQLGKLLAKSWPAKADVVVPVPDTARSAAAGYSKQSGIPVAEGLIKNRYIARTFIMPSQQKREKAVRLKLNAIRHVVKGKRVVLIDDSIVRGTTSGPIVKLIRDAGAKKVHLRITCPPITGPCFYGIDIPTYSELIASQKTIEQIREKTGADTLAYQSIDDLVKAIGMKKKNLCLGCLNGDYPTEFGEKIANLMKKSGAKKEVRIWEEERQ